MAQEKMTDRIVTVVITLVVAGVLGVVGSALAGGALIGVLGGVTKTEFDNRIKGLETEPGKPRRIPSGAVIAFDLADGCPSGWSPIPDLDRRVIVGAVTTRNAEFGYRAIGGEKEHTLTIEEMPRHTHAYIETILPEEGTGQGGLLGNIVREERNSKPAGKSQPHNNMPPFIALYFCK